MKSRILLILFVFLAVANSVTQESEPDPAAFLVKISWSDLEFAALGANENDCLLILPDGHFHMEQRRQQFPKSHASLRIHEGLLSDSQLRQLQSILSQPAIANLPKFMPFSIQGSIKVRRGFQADISRNQENVQTVGYMDWELSKPDEASLPAESLQRSQALANAQQSAKRALKPLRQWFLNLESQQLRKPNSGKSTRCQIK